MQGGRTELRHASWRSFLGPLSGHRIAARPCYGPVPLPDQRQGLGLNVIETDAETDRPALLLGVNCDLVSSDPFIDALKKCLTFSFQQLTKFRQSTGIHA